MSNSEITFSPQEEEENVIIHDKVQLDCLIDTICIYFLFSLLSALAFLLFSLSP